MKKVTLLIALGLVGILGAQAFAQVSTYRFTAAPMAQINRGQTAVSRIQVTDNFQIADVRVAVYAKVVMFGSLRLELISPTGTTILLKEASSSVAAPWFGPLGTKDSYCLFRDGGISFSQATAPNDRVFQPTNFLSLLNAEKAQGWWTLKIIDEANNVTGYPSQEGTWLAWELYMNKVIQEPEQVLYDQILVGNNLVPQINGRHPQDGAIIPNWHGDLDNACSGGIMTLGRNGDCFPFIITGIPGNIGDIVPPLVTPGRFELELQLVTSYPNGPSNNPAQTGDVSVYFGQAVENFVGTLPTPPATHPNPTVASQWPTGPATTTNSLYPGPEGINGGVRLVACPNYANLAPADVGGFSGLIFSDNALTGVEDAGPCGNIFDPSSGICGEYKPMQTFATMNGGRAVNGLYYVSIYDTYGDAQGTMRNAANELKFGQIRVLSIRLRYLAGGGNTPSPNLHQGIAGPLKGVQTPGVIDGAVLGYRTSVGNTIPPYSMHGITPTTNPLDREPILYFTNIQKMYQGNSIGYMHEELINTSTGSWSTVGNHGPFAYPGSLDDNQFDPSVAGNSSYADVIQIANGSWKMRHKLVQARYDADPRDNEVTGPEFAVTPNTFAYYKDKVFVGSNVYTDPNATLPLPIGLLSNRGMAVAFTLFQFPTTKIASVDYLMDMLAANQGVTPQSNLRITIWPSEFGLTGEPVGPAVGMSTTVAANEYIPGQNNWRTFAVYPLTPNGGPDVTQPGISLPPGTYYVTIDNMGPSNFPLFPYTYGQAPTLSEVYFNNLFSDSFGPIGPAASFGSHLSYISTDPTLPPDGSWGTSGASVMANYTLPVKLNMDYKDDFAIDYVTFDGILGNESVAMPNAPFTPRFVVSSRTLQGGLPSSCNVQIQIYQGNSWQNGDYIYNSVVTLNPYETIPVVCSDWNPLTAGNYTVEASILFASNDYNLVNNHIKFNVFVSSTKAIIVAGNRTGNGVSALENTLRNRGHQVEMMDANQVSNVENSTIYVVGDVNNTAALTAAVENGNQIAFVSGSDLNTIVNSDKVFQVERVSGINVQEMKTMAELDIVDRTAPKVKVDPIKISATNKEELLQYVASQDFRAADVTLSVPTAKALEAQRKNFASVIPAVKNSPFGDLQYIGEKESGIVYVVPTMRKSAPVEGTPNMFVLEQNYPNPFNPSTTIAYSLTESAQVTLRVLDMLGKEVVTLVNDSKAAGSYTVSFNGLDMNGNSLPSGAYMYRIDVTTADGTQTASRMMTLSK